MNRTLAASLIMVIVFSAVSIVNLSKVSASSTSVFQDGFESGSLNNWNSATLAVIVQSPVHTGSYAAKASGPNSYWQKTLSADYNDLYLAGYIQFPSKPSNSRSTLFLYISDASNNYRVAGGLRVDSSGNAWWLLRVNNHRYLSSSAVNVQAGRWYFMQIEYSTSGTANLWVDDSLVASASGQALYNPAKYVQGGNPTNWIPSGFVSYGDDYVADINYISSSTTVPSQPPTPPPPTPPPTSTQFGFGVYSDQGCTIKISNYNWGTLSPGASNSIVVYVRNEGNVPITLQKQMLNTNPTNLGNYLTVDWDYNNQALNAGQVLRVTLVLKVSSQITGISSFGLDFAITATG